MRRNIFTITAVIITAITLVIFSFIGCGGGGGGSTGGNDDTTPPVVVSVSSTGLYEVRVEFSETVNEADASDETNYVIIGLTVSAAVLDSTAKVVHLTTSAQSYTFYDITVSSAIKDQSDNSMSADYTGSFEGATDAPRVENVSAQNVSTIRVEFSEEVDDTEASNPSNYSLSPSINISAAVRNPGGAGNQFVDLTLDTEPLEINYTLLVSGIQDLALNDLDPLYNEISFTGDVRPIVTSVTSTGSTEVRVEFSEPMDALTAEDFSNYDISGLAVSAATIVTNTVVQLTTDPQTTSYYDINISGVTDTNGNTISPAYSGGFKGDQDAPRLMNAVPVSSNTVRLEFSEALDPTTAQDTGNYSLSPSITINTATLDPGSAGTQFVDLVLDSDMSEITYTLTVINVEDTGNTVIDPLNDEATFTGDVSPTVILVSSTGTKTVRVEFSEAVTAGTAGNIANYSITGLTVTGVTVDTDTIVRLTTDTQAAVSYDITISGVSDTNNNMMSAAYNGSFDGAQDAPRVIDAEAISVTTVRVEFSEALDQTSAEDALNYTLTPLITVNSAKMNPGLAGTQFVDLTLAAEMADVAYTVTVTNVKDKALNTVDPANNSAAFNGDVRPTVTSVTSTAISEVRVEYSEAVSSGTAGDINNYSITSLNILAVQVDSDTVVRLTTSAQSWTDYPVSVSGILDSNGNEIQPAYSGSFTGSQDAPRVVNVTATSTTTVRIEFSEELDTTSAEDTANYSLSPSITINTATQNPGAAGMEFVDLALDEDMENTSYTLTVSDIMDIVFNSIDPLYDVDDFAGDARPKVALITTSSQSTVRVRFTEDVDQTTAEDETNYAINQVGGGSLTITAGTGAVRDASDSSIVTLTTDTNQVQDAAYEVVINNVTDLNSNTVAAGTKGYFIGNGPPSVASAVADGPTKVIVTFSEPLDSADDTTVTTASSYSISGLTISSADWPSGGAGDRTIVELTTSAQQQQIYTLVLTATTVSAADDSTDIGPGYNSASFQGDGLPTVSSAMAISSTEVKVIFSEPVSLVTAENYINYSISGSLSVESASRNADPYTNEVVLTTSGQGYDNYTLTVTGVNDTTGNAIAGSNTADFAGIGVDSNSPSILNMSSSGTDVRIYFNESVEEVSAETVTNYTLSDLSTASLEISGQPTADQTMVISVPSSDTGISSITITARTAENLALNEFKYDAADNQTIAYSMASAINADAASPVRAYVHYIESPATYKVELVSRTYGADGDISITNNLGANVTVTGPNASTSINPSTAVRSPGNYSLVDLSFTASSGNYELTVSGVEDMTANVVTETSGTVIFSSSDTEPPALMGAFSTDSTHINLLFDEPVDFMTSAVASNFAIERETGYFTVTSGSQTSDTCTLYYDGGSSYVMTAGTTEVFSTNTFIKGNTTVTASSLASLMNGDGDSPVYAHAVGAVVYIGRRTIGSGDLDSVSATGFTVDPLVVTQADYTNNRTINASARNEDFPREVILTLDTATPLDNSSTHNYGITATKIKDISVDKNAVNGGTRVVMPIGTDNTTPPADIAAPQIMAAESLSDQMVRIIFNEPVEQVSAETTSNYAITPSLTIISASMDPSADNIVILYTELQGALTYTLVVNNVQDQSANAAVNETASFTGMATVTVDNGPVGNTINGIGNVDNESVTAMIVFTDSDDDSRLYIATKNKTSGKDLSEVHASDLTGVYFTLVNTPGFTTATSGEIDQFQVTGSFAVYDDDGAGANPVRLWASTGPTPSIDPHVFSTEGYPADPSAPHTWSWDTTAATQWGGNRSSKLLTYGIATENLYVIQSSELMRRDGVNNYTSISSSWDAGSPSSFIGFGGRMYVGVSAGGGMKVFRSKGANADAPLSSADFEQVLDSDSAGVVGMDGYDADDNIVDGDNHFADNANTSVVSMAGFKGYIYIGTLNANGAQVWRSQDGLTWERVLDFGDGAEFDGLNDANNTQITSMAAGGNYLYAGTKNGTTGGEVWRSPDGVTWEQFGSDGFGSTGYTDVTAMAYFNGMIYIAMEDTAAGGAIFRASN